MRFFYLQDYQQWLLAVFLGLVLTVLVYLAFRSYPFSRRWADERAEPEFYYPDGIRGRNSPTPVFFIFLYLGFICWMISYVIYIGLLGGPI